MTCLPRHSILPGPHSHQRSFIRLQFWSITLTWWKLLNKPHHVLLLPALSGIMSSHATVSASCLYCFACLSMLLCELSPTPFLFSLGFCRVLSIRFLTVNGFGKQHGNLQLISWKVFRMGQQLLSNCRIRHI